jgi:iron complex transport system ATP-binding protein
MSAGLVIDGATVSVDGHALIRQAGLTAAAGQLTALIGPNGAGKSTLMRAALGLLPLAGGTVTFDGADLMAMTHRERSRSVAFVEQSAATEDRLTARDVVELGRIPFQSIWQAGASRDDDRVVEEALDAVGMGEFASRQFGTLSGGEQQRVQLARALAQQPRLLILDEPTSHLDIKAQLLVLEVLRRKAEGGTTVLLALHDLNLAAGFCDCIAVLSNGQLVAQGTPDAVLTPALLRDVFGVAATRLVHPDNGRIVIAYEQRNTN